MLELLFFFFSHSRFPGALFAVVSNNTSHSSLQKGGESEEDESGGRSRSGGDCEFSRLPVCVSSSSAHLFRSLIHSLATLFLPLSSPRLKFKSEGGKYICDTRVLTDPVVKVAKSQALGGRMEIGGTKSPLNVGEQIDDAACRPRRGESWSRGSSQPK